MKLIECQLCGTHKRQLFWNNAYGVLCRQCWREEE